MTRLNLLAMHYRRAADRAPESRTAGALRLAADTFTTADNLARAVGLLKAAEDARDAGAWQIAMNGVFEAYAAHEKAEKATT